MLHVVLRYNAHGLTSQIVRSIYLILYCKVTSPDSAAVVYIIVSESFGYFGLSTKLIRPYFVPFTVYIVPLPPSS